MASRLPTYLIETVKPRSPLRELSRFLNKDGPVWLTVKLLAERLKQEDIKYAAIGGIAVYQHGYERTTRDFDILLSKLDHEKFMKKLVELGLEQKFPETRKKFISTDTGTSVDVTTEGEYPDDSSVGPVAFPNPEECRQNIGNIDVITLSKLIELKLASYQSLPTLRSKDLGDVVELILTRNLNRSFSNSLNPSVREQFEKLILDLEEEKKRGRIDNE